METIHLEDLRGMRVTIMGLGLNGGGVASARFMAQRGARVTVTDTKDEASLAGSMTALSEFDIRYVLGRHDIADFRDADLVIKNPAVRPDNQYLAAAKAVETDLSVFLRLCPARIAAVTGSKGKSTVSTAIAWMLNASGIKAFLGGNITISPLGFLDAIQPADVVVLELSSWQLGDLYGRKLLKPKVAVITRIVPDHLDRYGTMDAYVSDKRLIYADQDKSDWTVYDGDDEYGLTFAAESRGRGLSYGQALPPRGYGVIVPADASPCMGRLPDVGLVELVPASLRVPGGHNRRNLAAAALAAWTLGADAASISRAAGTFPGVEHRLEPVLERNGVRWFNDSAATVPEAVSAAIDSFDAPVLLITGGTDKKLDFEAARAAYKKASAIILLSGSGTDKIRGILEAESIKYSGPYDDIVSAVCEADRLATPGSVAVLSPGCTSFGMFKNEFDRGKCYKSAVAALR